MSQFACISIGISEYSDAELAPLPGARVDAENFFAAATGEKGGLNDADISKLLLNPTTQQVRDAVADFVYDSEVSCLTIFFAGHGAETKSGYFLACSDSSSGRLALSALSLTDLFQMLNESSSLHVNVVIDACQAGGVALDIPAITKSFEMGASGGLSISLLALSSRYQSALEAADGSGGYGTNTLLRVMDGSTAANTNKSELTLADVAQALKIQSSEQSSSFWSFNLQGAPGFCKNRNPSSTLVGGSFDVPLLENSFPSGLQQDHKERLWQLFLELSDKPNPRELLEALEKAVTGLDDELSASNLLLGIFESFFHKANESEDAFSPILVSSIFAIAAADLCHNKELCEYFLRVIAEQLVQILSQLASDLDNDALFLVRGAGGYSEFYSLPQRISQLAAWAVATVKLHDALGLDVTSPKQLLNTILQALSRDYFGSFELMSEWQAPAILTVSALCSEYGCKPWAMDYIGCLYQSYFWFSGKVAKTELAPEESFKFLEHRLTDDEADYERFCSRPSEALFVLFAHFWLHDDLEIVRYDLEELDGVVVGTFVPQSYQHFSDDMISVGSTIYFRFGFEIFTVSELENFFEAYLRPRIEHAQEGLQAHQTCTALLASLVFPDRMPWHIVG